jgi:2-polyprenyl-3-methyl-5-hydroxy-6-metoxy-1,4-benzoquinol methylase
MKRIIGRRNLEPEEYKERLSREIPPIDIDKLFMGAVPTLFRFSWASSMIDQLLASGNVIYTALDIGANDGLLCAVMATKRLTPGDDTSSTIQVDGIETNDMAYRASEYLAQSMRARGFKMNIHKVLFENYETKNKYDAIFAFEVLEHTLDPLFCIEKMYDLLEIGGYLFITVPEEYGRFGVQDKNPFHYWTATLQSLVSVLFYDDRKWHIVSVTESDTLIHVIVQKRTHMA